MTDTDNMIPSRDARKPAVLIERQDEITIEIDDAGSVILRQSDALGDRPDTIVVARAYISAFIMSLILTALPPGVDDNDDDDDDDEAEHPARRDPTGAVRQARYRERKRGNEAQTEAEFQQSTREAAE